MAANTACSDEIKNAVKKKVLEFDAYIDDELVEYIMVMIANKKTQDKMTEDLELFLGDNSILFVQWLFEYMENESKGQITKPKDEKKDPKSKQAVEEEAVISIQPEPADFEEIGVKRVDPVVNVSSSVKATVGFTKGNKRKLSENNHHASSATTVKKFDHNKEPSLSPSIKKVRRERDVKTDKQRPKSSVLKVIRPRPQIPSSKQASRKLLSRAVKDAFHSLSHNESDIQMSREKPPVNKEIIQEELSEEEQHRQLVKKYDEMREKRDREESLKLFPNLNVNPVENRNIDLRNVVQSLRKDKIQHSIDSSDLEGNPTILISPSRSVTAINNRNDKSVFEKPALDDRKVSPVDVNPNNSVIRRSVRERLGFSSNKNVKDTDVSSNKSIFERLGKVVGEAEDVNDNENSDKAKERCRFWPICNNMDQCDYLHPTIPCRNFPRCTFGNKCIYVHPKCKYDGKCNKSACPYVHFLPQIVSPFVEIKPAGAKTRSTPSIGNASKYTWRAPSVNIPDNAAKSVINKPADTEPQLLS